MPELFDKELSAVIDRIGYHIGDAVAQHERRYLGLVRKVHETAAAALNTDIAGFGNSRTRIPVNPGQQFQ